MLGGKAVDKFGRRAAMTSAALIYTIRQLIHICMYVYIYIYMYTCIHI